MLATSRKARPANNAAEQGHEGVVEVHQMVSCCGEVSYSRLTL